MYTVINGEKKCHSAEYRTVKKLRRKLASYQTTKGFTRYYYTDEFEEYEKTGHGYYYQANREAAEQRESANRCTLAAGAKMFYVLFNG